MSQDPPNVERVHTPGRDWPWVLAALLTGLTVGVLLLALPAAPGQAAQPLADLTFAVNSPADVSDANPGDGVCETAPGNGICTLRAAVQEANRHVGADTITLQPNVMYLLTQIASSGFFTAALVITDAVTILGAGPDSSVIDGNGDTLHARVFYITNTVTIAGVTIQHGASPSGGGGIYSQGRLTLDHVAVLTNAVTYDDYEYGGGIFSRGPLTITNSLFRGNTTGAITGSAGAIYISAAPMLIMSSTFSNNRASGTNGYGGALATNQPPEQPVTIVGSTFDGNSAKGGGAIYQGGGVGNVINSTISGNSGTGNGGGLFVYEGTLNLLNSTITDNLANADGASGGNGGGVLQGSSGVVNFRNSIIANNHHLLDSSGPLYQVEEDDCAGMLTSQGNTLMLKVDPGHCTVAGSVTITNPLLGALADHGGPTLTHLPGAGSPAINAGNSGGCTDALGAILTTDQRGATRTVGPACDIGAVETGAAPLLTTLTPPSVGVGTPSLTLLVDGSGFLPGTVAFWNGAPRPTTVQSSSRLAATLGSSDLATAGTYTVSARYGQAADSLSNALTFSVTNSTPTLTSTPTAPPTQTPTASRTPTPPATNTPVPAPTNTPVPGPSGSPTNTSVPIATNTPVPLLTSTPTATGTVGPPAQRDRFVPFAGLRADQS